MFRRFLPIPAFVALACHGGSPPPAPPEEPGPGPATHREEEELVAPPDVEQAPPFVLGQEDFVVEGDRGPFDVTWTAEEKEPGLLVVHFRLAAKQPATPPALELRWSVPSVDVDGYWNPNIGMDKSSYGENRVTSRATTNAPVFSLVSGADRNRMTVAVSDGLNRVDLSSYLKEEDARFHATVRLFGERLPETDLYETEVRIDLRSSSLTRALAGVSDWWAAREGYTPAEVPEAARLPVYSTWYNFHQNLEVEEVLAELELARKLGYGAVIVDDGWQTLDDGRGYAHTGDWEPERIPDMKGFVGRVHDLGLKFMLWYSVPFMGDDARLRKRFKGKYLGHSSRLGAHTLDPRYPEVREHIIGTYEKAVQDWDVDGLKLDFIDRFVPDEDTRLTRAGGRDYASVNAAVDRLMSDIMVRLRAIKPDIMIEFRQKYIGPLMRKYGNMFRAVDCPNNAVVNRARVADLRLLAGGTAVHSDMLMWHPDEPVEHAALQILNVLFAVPQLSVRLRELPEDHLTMVKFWTAYWRDNRDVLLDGSFRPESPAAGYPVIVGRRGDTTIAALYADRVVDLGPKPTDVVELINAKHGTSVVFRAPTGLGKRRLTIRDATGEKVDSVRVAYGPGVHELHVPPSGLARLEVR